MLLTDPGDGMIFEDPMLVMIEFISKKGLRLLEFFKQFDKDGGGSIDREEFIRGLKVVLLCELVMMWKISAF